MQVLSLVPTAESAAYTRRTAGIRELGVDVTTLSVPGAHVPGETTRSVWSYLRYWPRVLCASFEGYDLVHANQGVVAPIALTQPTRPVVLSLWGTDLYGRLGPVSRWCARRADAVVVMSKRMNRALDVDAYVVPHGVDLATFRPQNHETACREMGWDPDSRHVLFPYSPERPVKKYSRAQRVVNMADEQVEDKVRLHAVWGRPHEEMPRIMAAVDTLLLTSTHEGSPNAVKEAMACNLPVVTTDVGDVRERLAGVQPSFVRTTDVGLASALVETLERGERSNGREAVRNLDTAETARRLRSVYEAVTKRHVNEETPIDGGVNHPPRSQGETP